MTTASNSDSISELGVVETIALPWMTPLVDRLPFQIALWQLAQLDDPSSLTLIYINQHAATFGGQMNLKHEVGHRIKTIFRFASALAKRAKRSPKPLTYLIAIFGA